MRDMLEARKRGDYAFRDKEFKTAIDCYSQVEICHFCRQKSHVRVGNKYVMKSCIMILSGFLIRCYMGIISLLISSDCCFSPCSLFELFSVAVAISLVIGSPRFNFSFPYLFTLSFICSL